MSTPMLQEYFFQLDRYRSKFQLEDELMLLMQVGSFYEAYEIGREEEGEGEGGWEKEKEKEKGGGGRCVSTRSTTSRGCAKRMASVLRIHLTKKNGKIPASESNPWMVGFPVYVLAKHVHRLNEEGYTVVVLDQVSIPSERCRVAGDRAPATMTTVKYQRRLRGVYSDTLRMDDMDDHSTRGGGSSVRSYEGDEEGGSSSSLSISSSLDQDRFLYGLFVEKYSKGDRGNGDNRKLDHRSVRWGYLMSLVSINLRTGKVQYKENEVEDLERDGLQFLLGFPLRELLVRWCGRDHVWGKEERDTRERQWESILSCTIRPFLSSVIVDRKKEGKEGEYENRRDDDNDDDNEEKEEEGRGTRTKRRDVREAMEGLLHVKQVYQISAQDDLLFELQLQYHPMIVQVLSALFHHVGHFDPSLMSHVQKPLPLPSRSFFYNRDAFWELNLFHLSDRQRSFVSRSKQRSMVDFLSRSMNALGKRYLRDILQHPLYDQLSELQHRHRVLRRFLEMWASPSPSSFASFSSSLDTEWMYLRWKRGRLSVRQIAQLILEWRRCYDHSKIHQFPLSCHLQMASFSHLESFFSATDELWDLENMVSFCASSFLTTTTTTTTFLRQGQEEVEKQRMQLELEFQRLEERYRPCFRLIRQGTPTMATATEERYSSSSSSSSSSFRHEDTVYFSTTIRKWESFQCEHLHHPLYEISRTKSTVKLSLDALDRLAKRYTEWTRTHLSWIRTCVADQSAKIIREYDEVLLKWIAQCSEWDCFLSLADFFRRHDYHFPEHHLPCSTTVENEGGEGGYQMEVENLRHGLYELVQTDDLFVPYSFRIDTNYHRRIAQKNGSSSLKRGGEGGAVPAPAGLLIYGMNSSGKSTFLKSVGMALWLSQCGLMVPATAFRHTLTDQLFTKIGTYDNLYLKHSTFVAEMCELHCMLQRATPRSFLLCDELTSGTETLSATGIVASCITHFLRLGVPFLMSTHLHSLTHLKEIGDHPKLRICHFEIASVSSSRRRSQTIMEKSEENHRSSSSPSPPPLPPLLIEDIRLRYDRTLKDGSGKEAYGIEIAESLGLPSSFIKDALRFRSLWRRRHDTPAPTTSVRSDSTPIPVPKVSRYNSKLIVDHCMICQRTSDLHTHHITPQKEWSQHRAPSHVHKHGLFNLIVLCETCHSSLHHHNSDSLD